MTGKNEVSDIEYFINCDECEEDIDIEFFMFEDKVFSKCFKCRNKKRKYNHCICGKKASFNYYGETQGICCSMHRKPDMIDVKHKICVFTGCTKRPNFNIIGETVGILCKDHRQSDMIDVTHKTCEYTGCRKRPNFNSVGEKIGKFCIDHKTSNMVNVVDKKCEYTECRKRPNFNIIGSTIGILCFIHKKSGMIDVKHRICIQSNCKTQTWYGIPDQQPTYCVKHGKKIQGMIKNPTKHCQTDNCKEKAMFGIKEPLHCETHRKKDEENMCLQECKTCKNIEICNKDGICFEFCINSDLFKRGKHLKEIRIQKLLETEIKQEMFSCDKIIDSSCNKKRPDIVYETPDHFVIIEIDEDQHSSYEKQCEISRMKEITFAVGMPVFFVRYNPDDYKDSHNKKSKITKAKREEILLQWVKYTMKTPPNNENEFLRVVYLFYDGFSENDKNIKYIDMY